MKKFLKKMSVVLIGVLTLAMLLVSCTTAEKTAEDVKQGAENVTQGVKEGAKDITKGVEEGANDIKNGVDGGAKSKGQFDSANSKESIASLIGTWNGTEADGDKYQITLYEDLTYEVVKKDKNDKELNTSSGKYSVKNDILTLNKEKVMENGKTKDVSEVDTYTIVVEDPSSIKIKEDNSEMKLQKNNSLAEKKIK